MDSRRVGTDGRESYGRGEGRKKCRLRSLVGKDGGIGSSQWTVIGREKKEGDGGRRTDAERAESGREV